MLKKALCSTALVAALVSFFCLPAAAQKPQKYRGISQAGRLPLGTEEPCNVAPGCLFYAGDFDIAGQNPNALWNNIDIIGIDGTVYVPFNVPKHFKGAKGKTDWNVQGLFVNELMDVGAASSVSWSIVQGVAEGGNPSGGQVKTICSGTGVPSLTATGRSGFGLTEFTILVTGVSCPILEAGTYWMTVLPTVEGILGYLSDVEDNSPANAQGPGTSVIDDSFFVSVAFGVTNFANTTDATVCGTFGCDNFSVGVVGTAIH
jgi:hypothetical protein